MSLLLASTGKVSVIVLVGLGATLLLRRRSAAVRHWILAVAIASAAVTPLLNLMLPSWHIGLGAFSSGSQIEPSDTVVSETTVLGQPVVGSGQVLSNTPAAGAARTGLTMPALLAATWIAGAGISFVILLIGLARLKWLAYGARRIEHGRWFDLATEISRAYGLRRPAVLLQSDHPTLLVTWGLSRPKIILPAAARDWPADRAFVVLRHELAHIRRGDWAVQMTAEVLRAVYWFNPLVWITCARLRQESEHACDDAVLNGGVDGCDYATHLLDLARTLNADRRTRLAALAIARPSSLEGRVRAMLNTTVNRGPLTRSARIATVIAVLSVTLPIAGFGAQSTFFTFSGSVLDPTNRLLPNAVLVLTNTGSQAKHEVRSDGTGRFEFVGLPNGEYALEIRKPGFAVFKEAVAVAGRNADRSIELQVGSLEETMTVSDKSGEPPVAGSAEELQARRQRAEAARQRALAKCSTGSSGPVGGDILPPTSLVRILPHYPADLKSAKVGGVVTMEAVIGTDGNMRDVRAVASPHPDLESAAVEAVRQWQFSSTLLNCVPIEVRMRVTTRFVTEP